MTSYSDHAPMQLFSLVRDQSAFDLSFETDKKIKDKKHGLVPLRGTTTIQQFAFVGNIKFQ